MSTMRSLGAVWLLALLCGSCWGIQYKVTSQVYLDVEVDGSPIGRIVVGLFGEVAPLAAANFERLASVGVEGHGYKGTRFHRIVKRFMIMGGDVATPVEEFRDENPSGAFDISGLVAMANRGRDSNGCQFFIATVALPALNGRHTIFGKVLEGQNLVHVIEHVPTDSGDRPLKEVRVTDCGLLPTDEPFYVSDQPYDVWAWLRASFVPLAMSFSILGVFHWMIKRMEI